MDRFEVFRRRFRPKRTRVLLVGESRPANGTFFFAGDSILAKYTAEAFAGLYGPFPTMQSFLECFRRHGCYLVDLCSRPVNGLADSERRAARHEGECDLSAVVAQLKPHTIVAIMKAIGPIVTRAAQRAGLGPHQIHVLPFPAQGHQRKYVDSLRVILAQLDEPGLRSLGER